MSKLTLQDLERLQRWIEKKCDSLSTANDVDPEAYSEAKLTRGIFSLLLDVIEERRQQLKVYDWQIKQYDFPQYAQPVFPPNYTSANICPFCKQTHPSGGTCVHKVTSVKITHNTGS